MLSKNTSKTPCTGRGLFQEHHGWSSTKSWHTTKDMDIFLRFARFCFFFVWPVTNQKENVGLCVYIRIYIYIRICIAFIYIYASIYVKAISGANIFRKQLRLRAGYSLLRLPHIFPLKQPGTAMILWGWPRVFRSQSAHQRLQLNQVSEGFSWANLSREQWKKTLLI